MVDNSRSYRACMVEQTPPTNNRSTLRKLQTIDFAIDETVLYLNAYPECSVALSYYHKLVNERQKLIDALSKSGYPMTCTDNTNTDKWLWTNGPWPWQTDAN